MRTHNQVGATPAIHRECRTPEELAQLAAIAANGKAYYAANKAKWLEYSEQQRRRRGRA